MNWLYLIITITIGIALGIIGNIREKRKLEELDEDISNVITANTFIEKAKKEKIFDEIEKNKLVGQTGKYVIQIDILAKILHKHL